MKNKENEKYIKLGLTLLAVIAAGLLLCFILYRYQSIRAAAKATLRILRPFINGAVFAYILSPLCNRLEKPLGKLFRGRHEGWVRGIAIFIAIMLAIVAVWILAMMVIPRVWESLNSLVLSFPEKEAQAEVWLRRFLDTRPELLSSLESVFGQLSNQLDQWIESSLIPRVQRMVVGLGSHVADLLGVFKDLLLGLLISAYMLASRRRFAAQGALMLHSLCPKRWIGWLEAELSLADMMFNGFLVGKLLDSAIIGVLCLMGTTVLGIQSSVLVSAVVAVTNIIPFFGPFIGAIPCTLLILLENPLHALYFVIFIILLQQLDGNFIGPMILGDSTGLSGFWVMFAIILFGGFWGVPGMILGVPLFAVIYDILRQVVRYRLEKRGKTEMIETYDRVFHDPAKMKNVKRPRPRFKKTETK